MFYLVSSAAYGTKDAPRGWYKNLDPTMKIEDFMPLPYEPAAYVLHPPDGSLAGLVTVHVDDLLWTGGGYIEKKMDAIQAKYNFGKVSVNKFAYCGREVLKDERGAHITCPSLMDRVRMIHLTPEGRKKPDMPVSEKLRGQLRGVIGSLAWLARVCRPDLSYAVCKLQSSVHTANINDVKYANKIVELAKRDPNKGNHRHPGCLACSRLRRERKWSEVGAQEPIGQIAVPCFKGLQGEERRSSDAP